MERVGVEELVRDAAAFDAAAYATEGVDGFCSATDWILAAHEAWTPDLDAWIRRGAHGWAAMLRHAHAGMVTLCGFDTMWGFSCPLVGADADALADEFHGACTAEDDWDLLLITGIGADAPIGRAVLQRFAGSFRIHRGPALIRCVASLEGGLDAYVARRSRKWRAGLRRAQRRALERGIAFEVGTDPPERTMERVLDVERRSWKGRAGTGLVAGEMRRFYAALVARVAPSGRLRALFARRGGADVGYILGAVGGGAYRGFQLSYDDGDRDVGLGNLLQLAQISALAAETDPVTTYDLGIEMAYKHRWADRTVPTHTLAFQAVRGV